MMRYAPYGPAPEKDEELSDKIVLDDDWQDEKRRSRQKGDSGNNAMEEEYLAI